MYLNAAKFHRDVLQIGKKYKAKLRTDIDMSKVIAGNMEHNHESWRLLAEIRGTAQLIYMVSIGRYKGYCSTAT
jgi:hypothetical protein